MIQARNDVKLLDDAFGTEGEGGCEEGKTDEDDISEEMRELDIDESRARLPSVSSSVVISNTNGLEYWNELCC
jgi:hypothetical protein